MLDFKITDRSGDPVARIHEIANAQVVIPWKDARTSEVTFSMEEEAALYIKTLKYMLKVVWNQTLVFWGPITGGPRDYAAGTVTLYAHDPSWWWKYANLRYGDACVTSEATPVAIPVNGRGLRMLTAGAEISNAQKTAGVQMPGIWQDGFDDTPTDVIAVAPADLNNPSLNPGLDDVYWVLGRQRGDQVFQAVQDMSDTIIGLDWELQPIDAENLTDDVTSYPNGYFCQLNTYVSQGADLTLPDAVCPAFHFACGGDTLTAFTEDPDGGSTVNYAVTVEQSGEKEASDTDAKGTASDFVSWQEIGIMEKWNTGSQGDKKVQLTARSKAYVDAYSVPLQNFTFTPKPQKTQPDMVDPPQFLRDFNIGDVIPVLAKKGNCVSDLKGKIVKVTIQQADNAGGSQTEVECIPNVGAPTGTDNA